MMKLNNLKSDIMLGMPALLGGGLGAIAGRVFASKPPALWISVGSGLLPLTIVLVTAAIVRWIRNRRSLDNKIPWYDSKR